MLTWSQLAVFSLQWTKRERQSWTKRGRVESSRGARDMACAFVMKTFLNLPSGTGMMKAIPTRTIDVELNILILFIKLFHFFCITSQTCFSKRAFLKYKVKIVVLVVRFVLPKLDSWPGNPVVRIFLGPDIFGPCFSWPENCIQKLTMAWSWLGIVNIYE